MPGAATGGGHTVLVCSWRDRWHPDAGGAEVYLHHVTTWLRDHGWRVTVATAAYAGAARDEVVDGIRYVRRGGTFSVYGRVALRHLLGGLGRPDVIVDVQNGIPFLASTWSRRPVVVLHHHAHREQWRFLFGPLLGRLGWWVESVLAPRLQRRASYVTVSPTSRADLVAVGVDPDRITVVHNGASALPAATGPPSRAPSIIVLGRLVPHKRVEYAIVALRRLSGQFPDLTLDVVGDGDWRPQLEARAVAEGVAGRVRFHGHVDEATKAGLLHRAWVMALPSVKEGWGLVVLEAASVGVPTVAFAAAGGVRGSVVDGRTGHLATDLDDFVDQLGRLLGDDAQRHRMGAAAREHAASFTWDATATQFATVLTRAIAEAGTRA